MTNNSNKRRKKFVRKNKKSTKQTKGQHLNVTSSWKDIVVRDAISLSAWYLVDAALTDTWKQMMKDGLDGTLVVRPIGEGSGPGESMQLEHGLITSADVLKNVTAQDINNTVLDITGYSPLSPDWDVRHDKYPATIRKRYLDTEAKNFFAIRKLLEQTVGALIYLIIKEKYVNFTTQKDETIDKKTLPYQSLTRSHKGKTGRICVVNCFDCFHKGLRRISKNWEPSWPTEKHMIHSQMTLAQNVTKAEHAIRLALLNDVECRFTDVSLHHRLDNVKLTEASPLSQIGIAFNNKVVDLDRVVLAGYTYDLTDLATKMADERLQRSGPSRQQVRSRLKRVKEIRTRLNKDIMNAMSTSGLTLVELTDLCAVLNDILNNEREDYPTLKVVTEPKRTLKFPWKK
jgi:hypothetical protein